MVRKPTLQALVLADHVYIEQTGKKIIAGTFNRIWSRDFPSVLGRTTWAYICLTDLQGSVPIALRYTDLRTNEVLLGTKPITAESTDPLASGELIVEVPPFPLPHEGAYAFEVFAADESIGALRITVSKLETGK